MPVPRKGEKQRAFIGRCLAYPDLRSKPPKQRAGECYGIWREHHAGKEEKAAQPSSDISPDKAKQILEDNSAHGHPLTPAQRGMFGAAAGRSRKSADSTAERIAQAYDNAARLTDEQHDEAMKLVKGASEADVHQALKLMGFQPVGNPQKQAAEMISRRRDANVRSRLLGDEKYGKKPQSGGSCKPGQTSAQSGCSPRKKSRFAETMKAFRAGTLKDADGNKITCRKTARAMAVLSSKSNMRINPELKPKAGNILENSDSALEGGGRVLVGGPSQKTSSRTGGGSMTPGEAAQHGIGRVLEGFPNDASARRNPHTRKSCGKTCACDDCQHKHTIITTYKAAPDRVGLVYKNRKEDIETNDDEFSASGILASSKRDRQGDIIECSGVIYDDHMWNPTVLWDHGKTYNIPIGMTESPEGDYTVTYHPDQDLITQKTFFAPTKFARQIYSLIRLKFLRANSIAVKDLEVEKLPPQPEHGHFKPGKHILRSALAEVTWTPLPANPDAVASILGHGRLDVGGFAEEQIEPLIFKSLLPFMPPKRVWVPGGWSLSSGLTICKPRRCGRKSHA